MSSVPGHEGSYIVVDQRKIHGTGSVENTDGNAVPERIKRYSVSVFKFINKDGPGLRIDDPVFPYTGILIFVKLLIAVFFFRGRGDDFHDEIRCSTGTSIRKGSISFDDGESLNRNRR